MVESAEPASQFENGEEVSISFQYMSREIDIALNSLLAKALARLDLLFLYETLEAILREVVQNAVKANMKRVWFKSHGLDIHRDEDYAEGMRSFKEIAYHPHLLKDTLLESDYRVVVTVQKLDAAISLRVINNARIVPHELERIHKRIAEADQCGSFSEAFDKLHDDAEGAGLGIILVVMLVKNAGLDTSLLRVETDESSVTFSLTIPSQIKPAHISTTIKKRILDDVATLPTIPEHILKIQALCRIPDAPIHAIADLIGRDPSLTAEVLKIANSAGFITSRRITKVNEAVIVIGMNNLNAILYAVASRKILDARYRKFEAVWGHCNRVAFYARRIALRANLSGLEEAAFVAGLLHDMGKIVLLATSPGLIDQIAELASSRKIRSSSMIEELFIGVSHADIGGLVAEQWNFPDDLVEAVRFHHAPLKPSLRHRDLVMAVYLANELAHVPARELHQAYFEHEVMAHFGIRTPLDLEELYAELWDRYESQEQLMRNSYP